MIKLNIDTTLDKLDTALLPYVQWKAMKVSDLENVSEEILSTYAFEMNSQVQRSLIKSGRINVSSISDGAWAAIISENSSILDYCQIPYSAIMHMMSNPVNVRYYASKLAATQHKMPLKMALEHIDAYALSQNVLLRNQHPGLLHYMFTEEGMAILKKRNVHSGYFRYMTSEEGEKFGIKVRNRTITPEFLRRAGACGNGINYCTKMLKELKVESITWDDAIKTIRADAKLQSRSSLLDYMSWLAERPTAE